MYKPKHVIPMVMDGISFKIEKNVQCWVDPELSLLSAISELLSQAFSGLWV